MGSEAYIAFMAVDFIIYGTIVLCAGITVRCSQFIGTDAVCLTRVRRYRRSRPGSGPGSWLCRVLCQLA